ncbi:putative mitochondrial protein [Vitis vinifera]|uniref:Putative mitochondrial protein n=1 Tax=Vitis vinifera TaxID=29760 RepID=A0A438HM08_VITVI|nr:putative mitochondrial protein [Vitis vinifera]
MNQLNDQAATKVWTTYTKAHPGASQLRYKPIRNYDKLSILLGKDRAIGSLTVEEQLFEEIAKIGGMSDVSHMKAYQALTDDVSVAQAFLACPIDRLSPRFSTFVGGEMEEQIGEIPSVLKWEMINRVVHATARGGNLEILKELLSTSLLKEDATPNPLDQLDENHGSPQVVNSTSSLREHADSPQNNVLVSDPPISESQAIWITSDASLFTYHTNNITTVTLIYADDIFLTGSNDEFLQHLITKLSHEFAIKDLGSLHYFLGIEVKPFPGGMFLSQHKYTQDILHKTKMLENAPFATPMVVKDISSNSEPVDVTIFRNIIKAHRARLPLSPRKSCSDFLREKVAVGHLMAKRIPSSSQLADIFTKPLPNVTFQVFRDKIGVHPQPHTQFEGLLRIQLNQIPIQLMRIKSLSYRL